MCKRILKCETTDTGDIPFFKIGTFGKTADAFIAKDRFEYYRAHYSYPKKGSVLISAAGTIGRLVIFNGEPAYFQDSNIVWLEHDGQRLCDKYLYYFLLGHEWQISQGATIQRLYNDDVRRTEIDLPPLPIQRRIADILSAYDDLIENNRRRIAILEETARLAYRKWFGERNEQNGWRKCKVAEVLDSFHRPPKVPKESYVDEGKYPCIDQGKDFVGGYTNDREVIIERIPAIVFGDHTRVLKYVSCPFASGADGTQLLFAKKNLLTQEYLYFALKDIDLTNYFYARHFKILKSKEILIPPFSLVQEFSDVVSGNMHMIGILRNYNATLAAARDMLLPRLMKGDF